MPKNCSQMARWTHTSPAWANNSWTWRLGPWVNWCVQQHHHGWFGFIEFHWILRGIMVIYGNLWEFMVIIHQFNCVKYYSDITKPYCWPSYDPPMSSGICQTKRFTAALVFLPAMFSQLMGGWNFHGAIEQKHPSHPLAMTGVRHHPWSWGYAMVSQSSIDGFMALGIDQQRRVCVSPDNVNSIGVYPVKICINPFTLFFRKILRSIMVLSCPVTFGLVIPAVRCAWCAATSPNSKGLRGFGHWPRINSGLVQWGGSTLKGISHFFRVRTCYNPRNSDGIYRSRAEFLLLLWLVGQKLERIPSGYLT